MKKTTIIFILIVNIFVITSVKAFNQDGISYDIPVDISVYGDYLRMPSSAIISESITYAPARALSEALGAVVWWDDESSSVFVAKDGKDIEFRQLEGVCVIGDSYYDAKTLIVNGSAFVPVRFLAEILNFSVDWDSKYHEVLIYKDDFYLDWEHTAQYSHNDIEWLAKIVQKEVGYESFVCRLGVANVIMNRVKSSLFPNTVYDVIFDTKYGVQFPPAHGGGLNAVVPDNATVAAAKLAVGGYNNVGKSLYFIETRAKNSWAARNRKYFGTIGNEMFFE